MKVTVAVRRALCLVLAMIMLLGVCPAMAKTTTPKGAYVVNASNVYMRSGPSSAYAVMGRLKKGTVVYYKARSNNWYRVSWNPGNDKVYTGYVYKRYLTSVGSYSTTTKYATTVNLRVRSAASATAPVLGKLKKGLKVTVIKTKKSWAYISYKGRYGWVSSKYLRKAS